MGDLAALSLNIATDHMLLHILCLSGALAACPYHSDLFITAPDKIEALSGSCLQIPCNFSSKPEQDFDSGRETFGVWIKTDHDFHRFPNNVIFHGSRTVNTYPMNITGNLSEKNCTTLFSKLITSYTDKYFFRVENKPFVATAACDPLQITVKDSPPSPRIEIPGDLKEKQSVTITCSASTPCPHSPPKLTWNLQQDALNKTEENTDRTLTTKIQTTVTLSDQHDGYNITCSASYPVNEGKEVKTAEERKTLHVSYAPKNTSVSISPPGLVSAGSRVNLTCSSRAKPPVSRFTWFKSSKDGAVNVSEGDFYSFNVTDGGVYFCLAMNDLGSQTSSQITLNSAELPDGSLQWEVVLVGILGILILIGLVVCVCTFMCWRPLKSTDSTQQQSQSQTGEELAVKEPVRKTQVEDENVHYGEIDFSKRRPELSTTSAQDHGQQQDTLYAEVKVSKAADSLTHTADEPEDLYAQVKKK